MSISEARRRCQVGIGPGQHLWFRGTGAARADPFDRPQGPIIRRKEN